MSWKLTWTIPPQDLSKITEFYANQAQSPLVRRRQQKNVAREERDLSRDAFIIAMLYCLCTSQQPSGPHSRVANFFWRKPFPVTEQYCANHRSDLAEQLCSELSTAGIRFTSKIPAHFIENLRRLEDSQWLLLQEMCDHVPNDMADEAWERAMGRSIQLKNDPRRFKLKGFGPKQSRNLLQLMGVSRFEVPLDSRVTKWLHEHGFPYRLKDGQLQDPALYEIVEDALKELARRMGIYPCLLDSAVFSGVDHNGWTDENLLF